jgi:CHASE3 domain sensor protein
MLTFEEARSVVVDGKPTALDWFIVEHEPIGVPQSEKFRRELADVIREAKRDRERHLSTAETAFATGVVIAVIQTILFVIARIVL